MADVVSSMLESGHGRDALRGGRGAQGARALSAWGDGLHHAESRSGGTQREKRPMLPRPPLPSRGTALAPQSIDCNANGVPWNAVGETDRCTTCDKRVPTDEGAS